MEEAYTEAVGTMVNSGDWNGMESSELKLKAPEMIEKMGVKAVLEMDDSDDELRMIIRLPK